MSEEWNANALVGTHVGTCVLERPLGIGGMGAVYLARQSRPRRQVAVKLLRPRTTADPREWGIFLARFRREADATAGLDHANIVPIYEFGEDGTLVYLVMPYLPAGSLGALIAREGALPVGQAIAYLEQAAAALDCAHRNGIIHRDVKPSNLLLHPDGRLMLADFGIARPLDKADLLTSDERSHPTGEHEVADAGLTQVGVAMGTPEYMAPEQIRGEKLSPATDIYALGMVAYAMLTGHTPFAGTETSRILARQVNETPRPLRTFRPDVPPQVEKAVLWALAKNPAERPANGPAFARMLRSGGRPAAGATGAHRTVAASFTSASGGLAGTRPIGGRAASPADERMDELVEDPDKTIYDGVVGDFGGSGGYGLTPSGTPVWPGTQPNDVPRRRGRGAFFGCLGAIGLALAFLLLLTNAAGWLEGLTSTTGAAPNTNNITPIVNKPTPTPTPSPTPTPTPIPVPDNWLSAQPNSLNLACDGNSTQTITLTNLGNKSTDWQARVQDDSWPAGIQLDSSDGSLKQHRSVSIQVNNTSQIRSHSGVIYFFPRNPQAGQPAAVQYTTQPCGFGGGGNGGGIVGG